MNFLNGLPVLRKIFLLWRTRIAISGININVKALDGTLLAVHPTAPSTPRAWEHVPPCAYSLYAPDTGYILVQYTKIIKFLIIFNLVNLKLL